LRILSRLLLPLALIAALAGAGCVSPVTFSAPCSVIAANQSVSCMANAPATQATLTFNTNFDPASSLTLTYDNVTITNSLQPPPAPGGTSNAPIPPPPQQNYYANGASHTLAVNDTCGFFCVYPTVSVTFTPAPLYVFAPSPQQNAPINGSLSMPSPAFVELGAPLPSGTTQATLSASPPIVMFSETQFGPFRSQITIPISANANETEFFVQGVKGQTVGTPFTVAATVPGYQVGTQPGSIAP
jgi:hypothetical protein